MAVALFLFTTKRLQTTTQPLLCCLPLLLHPNTHPNHLQSNITKHILSRTFHRTFCKPFKTSHFSTFPSSSNQNLYDPFDFNQYPIHSTNSLDPNLLERANEFQTELEAIEFLNGSGLKLDSGMVCSAIWACRDEWRLAFLVFKWGVKWSCCDEKVWNLMIWVLGNCGKFNVCWKLIKELFNLKRITGKELLIMIDRYAAASDPNRAIRTFHILEKFKLSSDVKAFYTLLNALCTHGYIEEAEEIMLNNKKLFPLEAESFNIILNGWCNVSIDVFEAKRVWREMSKCCITPNATTYTHMISCFSKVGNLFDSLRLYDEMKKRSWDPDRKVYNSLIHVLTHENCLKEALKILVKMKESGLDPDPASYNSMIRPLCAAKRLEEAKALFSSMIEDNVNPNIETYHALLEATSLKETLELLNQMRKAGFGPSGDTLLLVIDKFFKLEQPENALNIWLEMKHQYEVMPDSSHYKTLVEGLAMCGWLVKAGEFYAEMRSHGFPEDPKLTKILKHQNTVKMKGQIRRTKRVTGLHHRKGK